MNCIGLIYGVRQSFKCLVLPHTKNKMNFPLKFTETSAFPYHYQEKFGVYEVVLKRDGQDTSVCINYRLICAFLLLQIASLNNTLPRVSYIKAIDIWLIACLIFVISAMLEFTLASYWSRKVFLSKWRDQVRICYTQAQFQVLCQPIRSACCLLNVFFGLAQWAMKGLRLVSFLRGLLISFESVLVLLVLFNNFRRSYKVKSSALTLTKLAKSDYQNP